MLLFIGFMRTKAGQAVIGGLQERMAGFLRLEWVEERGTGEKPEGEFTEEGIQIRLDEMRILFFRIRRDEEMGQAPEAGV